MERVWRCFEEGEFDARNAKGEGLQGGPPTGKSPSAGASLLLDARELRRSFGGGIGLGDDMASNKSCHVPAAGYTISRWRRYSSGSAVEEEVGGGRPGSRGGAAERQKTNII